MKSPVEQLPRRACAAGLTDSRASRATRATRGDAHAAHQSAHWQYCTSQHGVEQCIQGIVLGASQHASAQSKRACLAPWRSTNSPPIRHSHHCTAAHERPQLHCSTLKLRSLPLLSQLCAVQRASSAAPGRPLARLSGCGTEARRASASRIGGHVSCRRERAAQRGSFAHGQERPPSDSPSSRIFVVVGFLPSTLLRLGHSPSPVRCSSNLPM